MVTNKVLESVSWGAFIVLIGIVWWAGEYYETDTGIYIAIGVGLILRSLNAARAGVGIKVSKFSLFVGIVAFAIGGAEILVYSLPLVSTIVILIGLFAIYACIRTYYR